MFEELDKQLAPKQFKKNFLQFLLLILVLFLLASNIFTVYYLFETKNNTAEEAAEQKKNTDGTDKGKNEAASQDDRAEEPVTDVASSTVDSDTTEDEVIPELEEGDIFLEWRDIKTKLNKWEVFNYAILEKVVKKYNADNMYDKIDIDALLDKYDIYKVGVISEGVYKGKELLIFTFPPEGPAFRDSLLRVIKNENGLVLLSKYSDSIYGIEKNLFVENDKINIINLDYEKEILMPGSDIKLLSDGNIPIQLIQSVSNPVKIFEYKTKPVYKDNKGCYFVELSDGTVNYYNIDLEFAALRDDFRGYSGKSPNVLNITWNNGEKNESAYVSSAHGCSIGVCYVSAGYIQSANQLKNAGKTNTGDDIYELKDDIVLNADGGGIGVLQNIYDMHKRMDGTVDFNQFLEDHPLIFWKDPFGKYIEFMNDKYQPAVECGKPVIYLYPEKETDVLVYVEPSGGFSFTEPIYNNGWKVKASPDGTIYNYGDKTEYPYLFWEGRGNDYLRPEKGFVVRKNKIKSFLEEKLSKLGLVKNEYDEFIEFWLPKMQAKDYYFVTFVPKEEFDKIAPLSVFPKPDSVIRVFMDFEGLDDYIWVEEQVLETPERKGFTVVEWGGALH